MLNYKIPCLVISSFLCSFGLTTMGAINIPSFAQNQTQSTIDPNIRPNEPGSSMGGSNGGLNMFDLILRSQNTPSRSTSEVSDQQRRSLDANSEEFRRQQLERIRSLESVNSTNSTNSTNSNNPSNSVNSPAPLP